MIPEPGLYTGSLRHRRFITRPHAFSHRVFMAFVDIDRLTELMAASRLTGYNRWAWAAYHERDHFGDPARTLRARVMDSAWASGIALPDGPIFLLTNLRYAGYVFNPISLFYCYDAAGTLERVLAEVNNTYGGRELYWLRSRAAAQTGSFRAVADKSLYVSPFIAVDMSYEFVLTPPGDSLVAHMNVHESGLDRRRVLDATLTLRHQPWNAAAIRAALVRMPFMTAKVIAAIHWHALRLYLKGVPVVPRLVANGEGERAVNARRSQPRERAAAAPVAVEEPR